MIWDSENLFNKAAVYFQKANAGNRDDGTFPLMLSMGFEFLARATLAKVHPVLLADPQSGDNLMYAFGYASSKPPKSVPLKTVLHRLTVVIESFLADDFKFSTNILEWRNAEVHSADLPFEQFKVQSWQPRFYKTCKIFLEHLEKSLEDLLGPEEASAAEELISALETKLKSESFDLVAKAKEAFDAKGTKERLSQIAQAEAELWHHTDWMDKNVECPSCKCETAVLRGRVIRYLEPNVTEEGVELKAVVMPSKLNCLSCGLSLENHGLLFHQNLGEQYTATTEVDAKEHYGIEFDPDDYYESAYGND